MWGRVLAVFGGTIIFVFAVALWYYDHQKNISIISNWQKNYNSLMTDKNNVLVQNVRLTRQNRELEQQNKQLVADNGVLTDEKQNLSGGLTALFQKIDVLSEQIDQLQRANELGLHTLRFGERKEDQQGPVGRKGTTSPGVERVATTLSGVDLISVHVNSLWRGVS